MRIAQIVSMYEAVPPRYYGNTERAVSYLTEELVQRGHAVTLFASGDSRTSARLAPTVDRGLRTRFTDQEMQEVAIPLHLAMLNEVFQHVKEFDIVHCHLDYLPFGWEPFIQPPMVTTLHSRLDPFFWQPVIEHFPKTALVSVSDQQRKPLESLCPHWIDTVYNAVPVEEFLFSAARGDYLLFVGRIAPPKRVDWVIEIAKRTGMPLKIVATVDPVDREYFEEQIEPLLDHPLIEYLGEVDEFTKRALMLGAYAVTFLIGWPESFDLVMIEALACGTPVLALNRGSVPEVLRDGVTGIIRETVDELIAAVPLVATMDRFACRREAEQRFSSRTMALGYEQVYQRVIADHKQRLGTTSLRTSEMRMPISA